MSFFKEFKEDLSQAVAELLPGEEKKGNVLDLDDIIDDSDNSEEEKHVEENEPLKEEGKVEEKAESDLDSDLEEMFKQIEGNSADFLDTSKPEPQKEENIEQEAAGMENLDSGFGEILESPDLDYENMEENLQQTEEIQEDISLIKDDFWRQEEPSKEETLKEEASEEELSKEETLKKETSQEELFKEETLKKETSEEELFKEETLKEETSQEELFKGETLKEETSEEKLSKEETLEKETIQEEIFIQDQEDKNIQKEEGESKEELLQIQEKSLDLESEKAEAEIIKAEPEKEKSIEETIESIEKEVTKEGEEKLQMKMLGEIEFVKKSKQDEKGDNMVDSSKEAIGDSKKGYLKKAQQEKSDKAAENKKEDAFEKKQDTEFGKKGGSFIVSLTEEERMALMGKSEQGKEYLSEQEFKQGDETENPEWSKDETSTISKGSSLNGNLISKGSLELLGKVKGDVVCAGKLMVSGTILGSSRGAVIEADSARIEGDIMCAGRIRVGAGTVIIGNISAKSAVIGGAVKGDIDVNGPVVVESTAVVMGNIKARSFELKLGAILNGSVSQCYFDLDLESIFEEKSDDEKKVDEKEKRRK